MSKVSKIDRANHADYLYPDYKSSVTRSPTKPLMPQAQTLSELTGPVFGRDLVTDLDADLTVNGRINDFENVLEAVGTAVVRVRHFG